MIRFEFMDAVREVLMTTAVHPAEGPRTVLGHSIGLCDGDTLVVETTGFSAGVVSQCVTTSEGGFSGVLHLDEYRLTERIAANSQTGELANDGAATTLPQSREHATDGRIAKTVAIVPAT